MIETETTINLKNIHVGVWDGDDETPIVSFSFSKGRKFVHTLEWLDEDGDLTSYSDSHLLHSHYAGEIDRMTDEQIEAVRNSDDLTDDDISAVRRRLDEFLSAR